MLRTYRLLIAALAVLLTAAGASAQTNLLANPGFEDLGGSYNGWFTFGSGPNISTAADDNIFLSGAAASKIFGEFTFCDIGGSNFDVGGYGQTFTPVTGQVYEFGGFSYVSSEDAIPGLNNCDYNRCVAKVVFFDAASGGNEISGNEIVIGEWDTPLDEWLDFSVSAIAPPGALRGEALILFLQPACDTGSVFIDDLYLYEQAPESGPNVLANPSFDTDLSGWVSFGNVFYENRSWAVRTPTGCAKLFGTYDPEGSSSGMYQQFSASESSIWTLGINALTTCRENPIEGANENFILAKLVFYDSDTLEIDEVAATVLDADAPMGTWTHFDLTGSAPTSTAFIRAYILFVQPLLEDGAAFVDDISLFMLDPETSGEPMPGAGDITLHQNVPNPFNPATRIDFELARAGNVDLRVYDVSGRLVATLLSGHLGEGSHQVTWNGKTASGATAATGVYLYVLKTEAGMASRRMVLLR